MQLAVGRYPIYDITVRGNDFYGSPIGIHTGYWNTDKAGAVQEINITGNDIHDLVPSTAFSGGDDAIDIGSGAVGPVSGIAVTNNRIFKAGAVVVKGASGSRVADDNSR